MEIYVEYPEIVKNCIQQMKNTSEVTIAKLFTTHII
jgi:hypothetical protein